MRTYFIASICLVALLVAVDSIRAEQEQHQPQEQHALAAQQHSNDEYKTRLLQLLLSDMDSTEQVEDNRDEDSDESAFNKRMSYRYGKRMSYRYGKRSAMPYRFGKRGFFFSGSAAPSAYPSAQQIIDYIRMHENDFDDSNYNKRMAYRYGRSSD